MPHGKFHILSPQTIWELDPAAIGGYRGKGVRVLQIAAFTVQNFMADNSLLRASALTFTTLLSIIPLLALAFALLKGLGVHNRLAPILLEQMTAGSTDVVRRALSYVNNTNAGSLGAVGVATLLFTAVSTLGSVEEAFDTVWGVEETRSFYRKFSDYLSVLVSTPLLVLAATSITSSLQSHTAVKWLLESTYFGDVYLLLLQFAPYVSVWVALFLLYIFIPNTTVAYGSALLGAVLAGTAWEVAQWAYIHFQVGVAKYNAIYGTFAAVPIIMVWIYTSWIIVLFGMEVVAVHQHLGTFRRELRGGEVSQSFREMLALAALRHIGQAFHEARPGWGEDHLARRLHVPLRVMRQALDQLASAGFIVRTTAPGEPYHPARELDSILLSDVVLSLRSHGGACEIPGEEEAARLLAAVDAAVSAALKGVSLKDFLNGAEPASVVDKGGSVDI